jgi:monoamine oxidase
MTDILIIGAGAAGLTAARSLSRSCKSVVVLEARDRIGGRIHTLHEKDFSVPVEAGAEFIHGDLPLTKALLKEATINFYKGEGDVWNVKNGHLEAGDLFPEEWNELIGALKKLEHDMSIAEFLQKYFNDPKYDELRESILRFVQGYDAADATRASAIALREEWTSEEDLTGYHPEGGYSRAMDFLMNNCTRQGVVFHLSTVVCEIQWRRGHAVVITAQKDQYVAAKVLITAPVAVLRAGVIKFTPEIPQHAKALDKIETGGVIKFLVEFKEAFWENEKIPGFRKMPGLHFLFSDAFVPTWWTKKPKQVPLLTGWLAGPVTKDLHKTPETLWEEGLRSLAYLFDCKKEMLQQQIRAVKIINWVNDPFALGAYAYRTVETPGAMNILSAPIEDTLYFAGEAFYSGPEMGTVEAALASGGEAAEKMSR